MKSSLYQRIVSQNDQHHTNLRWCEAMNASVTHDLIFGHFLGPITPPVPNRPEVWVGASSQPPNLQEWKHHKSSPDSWLIVCVHLRKLFWFPPYRLSKLYFKTFYQENSLHLYVQSRCFTLIYEHSTLLWKFATTITLQINKQSCKFLWFGIDPPCMNEEATYSWRQPKMYVYMQLIL